MTKTRQLNYTNNLTVVPFYMIQPRKVLIQCTIDVSKSDNYVGKWQNRTAVICCNVTVSVIVLINVKCWYSAQLNNVVLVTN